MPEDNVRDGVSHIILERWLHSLASSIGISKSEILTELKNTYGIARDERTIETILADLLKEGVIAKEPNPADSRKTLYFATSKLKERYVNVRHLPTTITLDIPNMTIESKSVQFSIIAKLNSPIAIGSIENQGNIGNEFIPGRLSVSGPTLAISSDLSMLDLS